MSSRSPRHNFSFFPDINSNFENYLWLWMEIEFIYKKTVSVRCSVKTAKTLKWFSNLAENLANYGQFYWSITLFSVNHTVSRQTPLILAADWSRQITWLPYWPLIGWCLPLVTGEAPGTPGASLHIPGSRSILGISRRTQLEYRNLSNLTL